MDALAKAKKDAADNLVAYHKAERQRKREELEKKEYVEALKIVSDEKDDLLKLAGFHIGDGLYGIDIMRIKEVIQARPYPIRPVPHAPSIVEGVIQLRGVVIPVVDPRKRFRVQIDLDAPSNG